jgi:hypothetical protein
VLEVVKHEKELAVGDVPDKMVVDAQCRADRRDHEFGAGDRGQIHEPHALSKVLDQLFGDRNGKARLADPSGPGEGDEASSFMPKEHENVSELLLATDERVGGQRKVCRVDAFQRREVLVAELIDPLRADEIFQAMLAEIANAV